MKKDDLELEDELLPEYDLKSLRVRKLGSGRNFFGSEVVRSDLFADANLTLAASKLSEAAFAKIWDNPEDAEYDKLLPYRFRDIILVLQFICNLLSRLSPLSIHHQVDLLKESKLFLQCDCEDYH